MSKPDLKKAFNKSFEPELGTGKEEFHVTIFRLFKKADEDNLYHLRVGFPEHWKIFDAWKRFGVDFSDEPLVLKAGDL